MTIPRISGRGLLVTLIFFIVRDRYFFLPCPQPHALCQKVAVLFGMLPPIPVFVLGFLQKLREVLEGRVCHVPIIRIVHLLPVFQAKQIKGKNPLSGSPQKGSFCLVPDSRPAARRSPRRLT